LLEELPGLIAGSISVGLLTALFSMLWLLLVAYIGPRGFFRRVLIGYSAPSTVLTGFAILILVPDDGLDPLLRISLGLALILTPSFYRLRWDSVLSGLEGQRAIAGILGASNWQIFRSVILPQVWRPVFAVGALASLWAWGDFALSSVVAGRKVTLAMAVHALIDSYRLDAATVLVWIVALGGAASFAIFTGVGRVLGSKSEA
jgi:thiamine transport system permease protein